MAEAANTEPVSVTHLSGLTNGLLFDLQYSANGEINLSGTSPLDKPTKTWTISTKAENCSWNVYANKKPLSKFHAQSRPPVIDASTTGQVLRVGNQVYFLDKQKEDGTFESFVPFNLSLSLGEIARHGQYLIVTSRQKVTDVPVIERDPPVSETKADDAEKTASDTVEAKTVNDNKDRENPKTDSDTKDAETNGSESTSKETESKKIKSDTKEAEDKKADSDSEPEPEDDPYEVSNSEDELSAYESWSEGSTDLEEIGLRAIQDLRPEIPPLELESKKTDNPAKGEGEGVDKDSDEDTSSDEDESDKSCSCCHDSDSDASVVNDDNQRFESQAANDMDETWGMLDKIYVDDRDGPGSDSESEDGQWAEAYGESGWALFGDEDDFEDQFKEFDDDSDDCSECGEEGGTCAMPPDDKKSKTEKVEKSETTEPPLGMPMAQIHVYDTSTSQEDADKKPTFKRLFHYHRSVVNSLNNSPPAVHPSRSLLVWPIGDSKIMLADYKRNTYFIKRLRLSRLFSQHVSVSCRFSPDGQYLHMIALERHGKPPLRFKQMLKLKTKKQDKEKEKENEVLVYDLVLSTYRLSRRKTARAPPVLINQTKYALGALEEKYALPTYSWTDKTVFVSRAVVGNRAQITEIQLFKSISLIRETSFEVGTDPADMQIHLLQDAVVPGKELNAGNILMKEISQVRPFYKPEEPEKDEKVNGTEEAATPDSKEVVVGKASGADNTPKTVAENAS